MERTFKNAQTKRLNKCLKVLSLRLLGLLRAVVPVHVAATIAAVPATQAVGQARMDTLHALEHEYVKVYENDEGSIVLLFMIEADKPLAVGERMNDIKEEACMNGYNWEAFFNYYLEKHAPDILEGMDTDPEAGTYTAYFDNTKENKQKAKRFADIIISLIENEKELYKILRKSGNDIEWE